MENIIKIIECFNITNRGLITALQHSENGIPPGTIIHSKNGESWIVKKRIHTGILMTNSSEIYFDCETEFEHISSRYINIESRALAIQRELELRSNETYWYLLTPKNKQQMIKPEVGSLLKIIRSIES